MVLRFGGLYRCICFGQCTDSSISVWNPPEIGWRKKMMSIAAVMRGLQLLRRPSWARESTAARTPNCTFLHAWLAQLRVVKCNGNLRRCWGSIRTSPNSPQIQFPAALWPNFWSHSSSSSSFLCLILQPPHLNITTTFATFITVQVVGGRKLAHWSMSGCTKTYLKQEELGVPWLQARVSEKSRLAKK